MAQFSGKSAILNPYFSKTGKRP